MWVISDEEMVTLQNRMNDLWEVLDNPDSQDEQYLGAGNRLIGTLSAYMTADHYRKELKK